MNRTTQLLLGVAAGLLTPASVVLGRQSVPAAPLTAPAPVPAPAAEPKAKKAKAAAPAAAPAAPVAAPVVVAPTPVEQAATPAAAAPATTLEEDLKSMTTRLNTLRETVVSLLGEVKRLDKRVHREIKDARKRKRRAKPEEGVEGAKPRALSIFERPVQITDELCSFLAQPKGTLMSRSQVTKGVNNYVKEHDLKNKHDIKPDAALKKLLLVPETEALTYFNLQRYLNRHYVKAAPAAPAAPATPATA
jgi:chromatin remodeling complex protein RSC6